ncbi:MAG TPA: hypothetical protein VEU30_12995, partial [Thermoanaerobaculia bacterium]|nr:hypothetical protein [Thermoanaerobaculia bacterium]
RGIELHAVDDAVIRSNQISHYDVAISAGRVDPAVHPAREITIDHNHLDASPDSGTAIAIEAGSNIRFVNNVVNGYADAILLLGTRPFLSGVTVANNLVLGISRTAFVLRDPAAAALFDFNVFSTRNDAVEVEVDRATSTLARFLARGTMPRSEIASVRLFDRDLARLGGIETVDRGTAVANLPFEGKAPDLGVAER